MSTQILLKIKDFFAKNEQKIVLIVAFCLVSAISFEFGVLQGQKWQQKPLIIEKPINIPADVQNTQNEASEASGSTSTINVKSGAAENAAAQPAKVCTFVASKNSDKYHIPTCQWAKRIKPENTVCYDSVQEAEAAKKQKCSCIK
ncbi:MAG TPA: hypothetical protein PLF30_01180 [Candidatus Moranbacteria bacterium]|jgi:hypothetical protein|nr:hypothetical protein [Candidatus Moranbacteria bacterium]HQB59208.1 hypothetical protein [Candidatus Moranbacteria bacterium]